VNWDKSVDLLAGSGGGGMVAALAALDSGIEPLVVEKQSLVGGSTGLSGGIVWLPNNPLMRADGIADSHEDGLAYLADVVGDIGPCSSPARREMFLTAGYEMINFLLRKGVRLVRCAGWSDYYPNHKGGNEAGRATAAINPTRQSGRLRTPATPVKCCSPPWRSALKPICSTRPGGCPWFSSPTQVPRHSVSAASGQGPSTSTRPAGDSATSRTPTSRSARRCTPTRRCRAGRSSTSASSAGMCRAPTH
jgi:hypothetical protein